jgi:hypothetical protein
MIDEQAFKVGFLLHCAEQGMTTEQTRQHVKRALAAPIPDLTKHALIGLKDLMGTGMMLGTGLPLLGGGLAGLVAAKTTSSDRDDLVDEAKNDELVSEYSRLAEEARRRAQVHRLQKHLQTLGVR